MRHNIILSKNKTSKRNALNTLKIPLMFKIRYSVFFPLITCMKNDRVNNFSRNIYMNSHQSCSIIKGVLRNFVKFTGKHLCQSLFFNKVAGLNPATLLKKRLWHRCFPVNFAKFLRTPFLQNSSGRLLLYI